VYSITNKENHKTKRIFITYRLQNENKQVDRYYLKDGGC